MLVLTRGIGERLVIKSGETIIVNVLEIKGNQVRIGIEAPRNVDVYREEILKEKDKK